MTNHFFEKATIKNFRGIKSLEIDDLAQVNIFVGKNNCGKTSILEALFLITDISNPRRLVEVNRKRNIRLEEAQDIEDYFYEQKPDTDFTISVKQKKGWRDLTVKALTDIDDIIESIKNTRSMLYDTTDIENLIGFKYKFRVNNKKDKYSTLLLELDSDLSHQYFIDRPGSRYRRHRLPNTDIEKDYKETMLSDFSHASKFYNAGTINKLMIDKKRPVLLEALKKIEPKVNDIMVDDNKLVRVDLGTHFERYLPINLLGNGMMKILSVISSISVRSGRLLFFDEIESGLHVSSITTLWEAILKNAKTHKAQIFMTTHSLDVLEGLRNIDQQKLLEQELVEQQLFDQELLDQKLFGVDVACFRINKGDDDTLKASRYSAEEMEIAIDEIGRDIRQ